MLLKTLSTLVNYWPGCAFWWWPCRLALHRRMYQMERGSGHTWCRQDQTEGWESENRPPHNSFTEIASKHQIFHRTKATTDAATTTTTKQPFNQCPVSCVRRRGQLSAVSQWPNGNMPDCSVREPRFESHRGQLCLSRQPLQYTALGTGCTPLLQCQGRLSLPPFVGR